MRLIALTLAWLALATSAVAIGTPTSLGGTNSGASSVTSLDITTGATANSGTLNAVAIMINGVLTGLAVTDDASNTYTQASTVCTQGSNRLTLWYSNLTSTLNSGAKIHLTWTTSNKATTTSANISGLATSSPLDIQGTCANSAGSTTINAGSGIATGTLSQASEIVLGVVGTVSTAGTFTTVSPFTSITPQTNSSAGSIYWSQDIVSVTTTVTYNDSWATSRANSAMVWTFKGAGGTPAVVYSGNCALLGVC